MTKKQNTVELDSMACMEPDCHAKISYTNEDTEVPLYCKAHRTETGRHSYTRNLVPPKPKEVPEPQVELVCLLRKCRHKITMSRENYMGNSDVPCPKCGSKMIWHKDVKG